MFRIFKPRKIPSCLCTNSRSKTVVITGATSGIGKACAMELAKRNCRLILGCRNIPLAETVTNEIISAVPNASIKVIHLDLTDLDSVKQFSDEIITEPVDVLINNAGVMAGHFRMIKPINLEEDMAVNYLSPFYLTHLLIKSHFESQAAKQFRVVFVSSALAKRGKLDLDKPDFSAVPYSVHQAYSNSKLAQCLFARRLQAMYPPEHVRVLSMFTGGMVHTGLSRNVLQGYSRVLVRQCLQLLSWALLQSSEKVGLSVVHAALSDEFETSDTPLYILLSQFKKIEWPNSIAANFYLQDALFLKTCDRLGIEWSLPKDVVL